MDEIKILYSDRDIAVCVKPVGIASQSVGMPEELCKILNVNAVFPVHRLDVNVSGVMVYALNKGSAAALCRQFENKADTLKEYTAVAVGEFEQSFGELCNFLYHDKQKNKTYVVKNSRPGAREAVLEYKVEGTTEIRGERCTILKIRLKTGRSHQIRAQLAHIHHPLCGDGKYGSKINCDLMLKATTLSFVHPVSGEKVEFEL